MHLSLIHELEQGLHVLSRGGLEDDVARPGMARRRGVEQLLEMFAACCEYHLVRSELATWKDGKISYL